MFLQEVCMRWCTQMTCRAFKSAAGFASHSFLLSDGQTAGSLRQRAPAVSARHWLIPRVTVHSPSRSTIATCRPTACWQRHSSLSQAAPSN